MLETEHRDLFGEIPKSISKENKVLVAPRIQWQVGGASPRNSPGRAFTLGHEVTHFMNLVLPSLEKCLENPLGTGALRHDGKGEMKEEERTFNKLWELVERDPGILQFKNIREGFSEPILKDTKRAIELKSKCDNFRYRHFFEKESDGSRKLKMGAENGWGTENYLFFKNCIEGDYVAAKELFGILEKYKPTKFNNQTFPDQMVETAADFYSTEFIVTFIKSKFPDNIKNQRGAALDVLRTLPPTLFPKDGQRILNYVGSKKTNEARVFGILLANPHFRQLLGCRFTGQPTPKYCGPL